MKKVRLLFGLTSAVIMSAAVGAWAAIVPVTENIAASQTWTADNVYRLERQIYVLPGATLTIQAGTLVQSTANVGGSLAVCRGARIFVQGTAEKPVIMTSTNDDLTNWHEGCNEWGNLTVMGAGLISASHYGGEPVGNNTKTPTGLNVRQMEGLVADFPGDTKVMYGGADDDDDSGSISYLSLRYGGKVIGLANELNGLSLGGVGRATEIDHVEIINNVDDGIEIWGGTVNLKYVSIWNIGDDSLDVDQGWRGKAQFGLIVQGYSVDAKQGSGVGDNCFETDGAEDSDAQPITTANIYNFTVVGQPIDGDHGTAWRDNAHIQYHNCIFMELGEVLVKNDNSDGDGANGYGYNGTLSWADTWTTPYTYTSPVNAGTWNPGDFNDPAVLYQTQTSGNLAEITDSVFYNNQHASAYDEADARGVRNAANNNVTATLSPIRALRRGALVRKGGKFMLPVKSIDPLPANDALVSVGAAPDDGFFTPANYRGGFAPDSNWLEGWSAADAYGMLAGGALQNDDYKITYKNCGVVLDLPIAQNTSGTLIAVTNGVANSSVKIQSLPIPQSVVSKLDANGIYNDANAGVAYIRKRTFIGASIQGDMGKFYSEASIPTLTSTGKIKNLTTKNASIDSVTARLLGVVKMQASQDSTAEDATPLLTSLFASGVDATTPMSVSLLGVGLQDLSAPGQSVKYLKTVSKKGKDASGQKIVSLASISGGNIETGALGKILCTGGSFAPISLVSGASAKPMTISAAAGIYKVGAANTTFVAPGNIAPEVCNLGASKVTVIANGGDITPDVFIVSDELAKVMAKSKKIAGSTDSVGGQVGHAPLTGDSLTRRDVNVAAYLTPTAAAALSTTSSVFISGAAATSAKQDITMVQGTKAVYGAYFAGSALSAESLLSPDLTGSLVKVVTSNGGLIMGESWAIATKPPTFKPESVQPQWTSHTSAP